MSSLNINISGEDFIRNNLEKIKNEVQKKVDDALNTFGIHTVADAKTAVPKDEGHLANSITFDKTPLSVEVVVAANYGAYVEFGTRRFAAKYVATLPPDWQTFAAKFKGGGGGGSMEEFVERIMAWVLRKGIGAKMTKSGNISTSKSSLDDMQQAAYAIALHIMQNGIKSHPFLFPAVEKNRIELMKELNEIFK